MDTKPRPFALGSAFGALHSNLQGALWMLASAACYTTMATCLKLLAERAYPDSQMLLFRCIAGVVLLLPLALRQGPSVWTTPRPWVMARRCLASAFGLLLAFYAFTHMPLADAQALSFARSLFVVLLAALLLKERVGPWRQGAVLIGFIGVLVMLRPGAMQIDLAALAMLGSALLMGFTVVTVKDLSKDHSTVSLVLWMNAVTTLVCLPFALSGWRSPVALEDWAIFALLAVTGVLAQTFFTRGLTSGDASLMTLMDYARMPMAVLAGLLVFRERPDEWTLLGAAIVIGSTVFITLREARVAPSRAPPPPG